jgi:hypothetical protein
MSNKFIAFGRAKNTNMFPKKTGEILGDKVNVNMEATKAFAN